MEPDGVDHSSHTRRDMSGGCLGSFATHAARRVEISVVSPFAPAHMHEGRQTGADTSTAGQHVSARGPILSRIHVASRNMSYILIATLHESKCVELVSFEF